VRWEYAERSFQVERSEGNPAVGLELLPEEPSDKKSTEDKEPNNHKVSGDVVPSVADNHQRYQPARDVGPVGIQPIVRVTRFQQPDVPDGE
jgi:hypothetical protein